MSSILALLASSEKDLVKDEQLTEEERLALEFRSPIEGHFLNDEKLKELARRSGNVWVFGRGDDGQLGTNTRSEFKPAVIEGVEERGVIDVALGKYHSLFCTTEGDVYATGNDALLGRLGLSIEEKRRKGDRDEGAAITMKPRLVDPKHFVGERIVSVSCGIDHSVALSESGAVLTWGCGAYGATGSGKTDNVHAPVHVEALLGTVVSKITCGSHSTYCVTVSGEVLSWGRNHHNQLGYRTPDEVQLVPKRVRGQLDGKLVKKIVAGDEHVLCMDEEKIVYSWGNNRNGRLGLGHEFEVFEPESIESFRILGESGEYIAHLSAGESHSLAVTESGKTFAWGYGDKGRLGLGFRTKDQAIPQLIDALRNEHIVFTACGAAHSVAISDSGEVFTWGSGWVGALGTGSRADSNEPQRVTFPARDLWGVSNIKVYAGYEHTAVLRSGLYSLLSWSISKSKETRIHALRSMSVLTENRRTHQRMIEIGAVPFLVKTVHTAGMGVQEYGALILGNIASSDSIRDMIWNIIELPFLIDLLMSKKKKKRRGVAFLLSSLARFDVVRRYIVENGFLPVFISCVSSDYVEHNIAGVNVVFNLLQNDKIRRYILGQRFFTEIVLKLTKLVSRDDLEVQKTSGQALAAIIMLPSARDEVIDRGLLPCVIHLLSSRFVEVQRLACNIIANLALESDEMRHRIVEEGVLLPLSQLILSDVYIIQGVVCEVFANLAQSRENIPKILEFDRLQRMILLKTYGDALVRPHAERAVANLEKMDVYPEVAVWSVQDAAQWLASLGLRQYRSAFIEHNIDGKALLSMSNQQLLVELKITNTFHRETILVGIGEFKKFSKAADDGDEEEGEVADLRRRNAVAELQGKLSSAEKESDTASRRRTTLMPFDAALARRARRASALHGASTAVLQDDALGVVLNLDADVEAFGVSSRAKQERYAAATDIHLGDSDSEDDDDDELRFLQRRRDMSVRRVRSISDKVAQLGEFPRQLEARFLVHYHLAVRSAGTFTPAVFFIVPSASIIAKGITRTEKWKPTSFRLFLLSEHGDWSFVSGDEGIPIEDPVDFLRNIGPAFNVLLGCFSQSVIDSLPTESVSKDGLMQAVAALSPVLEQMTGVALPDVSSPESMRFGIEYTAKALRFLDEFLGKRENIAPCSDELDQYGELYRVEVTPTVVRWLNEKHARTYLPEEHFQRLRALREAKLGNLVKSKKSRDDEQDSDEEGADGSGVSDFVQSLQSARTRVRWCGAGAGTNVLLATSVGEVLELRPDGHLSVAPLPVELRITAASYGMQGIAVDETGGLYSWGLGYHGKHAAGEVTTAAERKPPTRVALGGRRARAVAAGYDAVNAVVSHEGELLMWGNGMRGALGGGYKGYVQVEPRIVPALAAVRIERVAVGVADVLALAGDGTLYVWGENACGQLGLGHRRAVPSPTVSPMRDVRLIGVGERYAAIVLQSGEVRTAGRALECGLRAVCDERGPEALVTEFTKVVSLERRARFEPVQALACGLRHCVAIGPTGSVFTWGDGAKGQLGARSSKQETSPCRVRALIGANAVGAAAAATFSAVVIEGGAVVMWGHGSSEPREVAAARRYDDVDPRLFAAAGGAGASEEARRERLHQLANALREDMRREAADAADAADDTESAMWDLRVVARKTRDIVTRLETQTGAFSRRAERYLGALDKGLQDAASDSEKLRTGSLARMEKLENHIAEVLGALEEKFKVARGTAQNSA